VEDDESARMGSNQQRTAALELGRSGGCEQLEMEGVSRKGRPNEDLVAGSGAVGRYSPGGDGNRKKERRRRSNGDVTPRC